MDRPIRALVISDYRDFHTKKPEVEIFIGLARLGVEVYIMTYGSTPFKNDFESAGIHLIDFHPPKKFHKTSIQRIRSELYKNKIDILHLFNNKAIINGIRAAKGLNVKVVLYRGAASNIHWYDPTAYLKFLHPRVDKIVCNSKGVEDYLHQQLFFDKTKTITINKGHRLEWYRLQGRFDVRKEFKLPSDSFVVVSVANNRKVKGIPVLLKAFNMIPDDLPIYLLLIGRDMDDAKNLKIIQKGYAKEKVKILGFRKDVLNIVSDCNVFALSSIGSESITRSVIEAMALGVTPVISDLPGNAELVKENYNGLITTVKDPLELKNAMLELYENQDQCRMMGEHAKKWVDDHLNADTTISETYNLYKELME